MEFPVMIPFFEFTLHPHLVFEILAYLVGWRYYLYLKSFWPDSISSENRLWIIIGGGFGAVLGARGLGLLEAPELLTKVDAFPRAVFSSKTVVGGLVGGLVGVELTKKWIVETHSSGDLFCFPIILSMMIGRVGCFLTGVSDGTAGLPTDSWLGMNLGDSILRHPTALYEIAVLGGIWVYLLWLRKHHTLQSGVLFQHFMTAYLFWRFVVEFIKPRSTWVLSLSPIQIVCLITLAYYAAIFAQSSRRNRNAKS